MPTLKKVLVVSYSQSGQLAAVVREIVAPLTQAGVAVHHERLESLQPFPFPWPLLEFFDAFPECVALDPPPIAPIRAEAEYDLIILAYQVWFLSPSLPVTAFLKGEAGRRLLRGKPVITVVACRNMWLTAQQTVRRLLREAGAELRDHVVLTDPPENALSSFITAPRWLLTGRRDAFWGLPAAGIPVTEIKRAGRFGRALARALARDEEKRGEPLLKGLAAAIVQPGLIMSERAGYRAFRVWSRLIRRCGRRGQWRRRPLLILFVAYLVTMIVVVVPFSLLLQRLLALLFAERLVQEKAALEEPSGSQVFRLDEFR